MYAYYYVCVPILLLMYMYMQNCAPSVHPLIKYVDAPITITPASIAYDVDYNTCLC